MNHGHTAESLIAFERRVAAEFEAGRIRAPVHLCSDGQAEPLLRVFERVRPEDWVFAGWRNHFHCLLKGMPEDELFGQIKDGRSMYPSSAGNRIVCSAIVGGILPIALGVAMGLRRREVADWDAKDRTQRGTVWVFVGDMTARTGLFHEFCQYATGHALPVRVVIEDNGLSTDAVTEETWGGGKRLATRLYTYRRSWPHVGTGKRVAF